MGAFKSDVYRKIEFLRSCSGGKPLGGKNFHRAWWNFLENI